MVNSILKHIKDNELTKDDEHYTTLSYKEMKPVSDNLTYIIDYIRDVSEYFKVILDITSEYDATLRDDVKFNLDQVRVKNEALKKNLSLIN